MFPAESQRILESFYGDAHVERTTELTDQVFGEGVGGTRRMERGDPREP